MRRAWWHLYAISIPASIPAFCALLFFACVSPTKLAPATEAAIVSVNRDACPALGNFLTAAYAPGAAPFVAVACAGEEALLKALLDRLTAPGAPAVATALGPAVAVKDLRTGKVLGHAPAGVAAALHSPIVQAALLAPDGAR
jgi:hypothetical protein